MRGFKRGTASIRGLKHESPEAERASSNGYNGLVPVRYLSCVIPNPLPDLVYRLQSDTASFFVLKKRATRARSAFDT